jgi:hypothetical protein
MTGTSACAIAKPPQSFLPVVMVMTDVFLNNVVNLLRKFAKIVQIFEKTEVQKAKGLFKASVICGLYF